MNYFGALIKAKREARGWSLREASEKIGISAGRLAEIERGVSYHTEHPTRPTPDAVSRIAGTYDLPVDYALAEAGYSPRSTHKLTPTGERLIAMFESLPEDRQELALEMVRVLVDWAGRISKD